MPEKPAFPAVVDCPLCHQPGLYLLDDVVTDGVWMHCESCNAHGDIITFAAQIWNISRVEAINRFADLGAASQGEADRLSGEYLRAIARLEAAEAFWEESAHQVWNHKDDIIACRIRELGLEESVRACSGLIGVSHPDQVAEFCHAVARTTPPRMREHGPSLVLPYYDMPGRITGLLLVQYDENFASRRTFLTLSGYNNRRKAEAGYFLLHTVLLPAQELFRSSYFVCDDPFWALQLQCINLKSGLNLLPLAAYYSGPEAVSSGLNWQSFAPTPRFFHSHNYTPDVISQAATAKGYVCVLPPAKNTKPYLAPDVVNRLALIRSKAETWQSALNNALGGMNETAAGSFVTKMTTDPRKLQNFFATKSTGLSRDFYARMITRMDAAPQIPVRIQKKWVVVERDDGWYTHTNAQICNARIRIQKIVHADSGERVYVGVINIRGKEIEFADRAEKIEKIGLLAFAEQHAAAAGELLVFDRMWNNRAYLAATQLHQPELVHVSGSYGWNSATNEFCFYQYSLGNDGSVRPAPYPAIHPKRYADFPAPAAMAPLTIRPLLAPSHENALIWTSFAAVTANLLAPVLGRQPVITACAGKTFSTAAAVAATLDCQPVRSATAASSCAVTQALRALNVAEWPVVISHNFNDKVLGRLPTKAVHGSAIVQMPELAALMAPGYGWQLIQGTAPAQMPDLSALRHVLPSYIQRCLETRLANLAPHADLLPAVLADLASWLKDIYGEAFHLPCALNRLISPSRAHEALLEAVNLGLSSGKLDILPRPRQKSQNNNYVLRNKQHWWLNQKAIDRYCISVGNAVPNWAALLDLFERHGLLRGEELVNNMPGLCVDKTWCDQFWSDYTAPNAQTLG